MPESVNERLRDLFLTHSVGLDKLTAHEVNEMGKLLLEAERELLARLRYRLRDIAAGKVEEVGTGLHTTRAFRRAAQEAGIVLHRHSPALYQKLSSDLKDIAQYEADFARRMIEEAIPPSAVPFASIHSVRPEVLESMVTSSPFQGHRLETYFGDGPRAYAAGVQRGLQSTISRNLAAGIAPAVIVQTLERKGVDLARRHLAAVTRTATQHVLNSASEKVFEANAGDDGVLKGIMWLSTLDMRTTLQWCVPRDHALYDVVTKRGINAKAQRYPWREGPGRIHWQCRSKSSPVTKSWQELGIKAKEMQRRDRVSMDGTVPRETTAEEWLKRQLGSTRKDQFIRRKVRTKDGAKHEYKIVRERVSRRRKLEKLYGKRKMEAWEAGEISLDDMIRGDGSMLTLEELGLLDDVAVPELFAGLEAAGQQFTVGGTTVSARSTIYSLTRNNFQTDEIMTLMNNRGLSYTRKSMQSQMSRIRSGKVTTPTDLLGADDVNALRAELGKTPVSLPGQAVSLDGAHYGSREVIYSMTRAGHSTDEVLKIFEARGIQYTRKSLQSQMSNFRTGKVANPGRALTKADLEVIRRELKVGPAPAPAPTPVVSPRPKTVTSRKPRPKTVTSRGPQRVSPADADKAVDEVFDRIEKRVAATEARATELRTGVSSTQSDDAATALKMHEQAYKKQNAIVTRREALKELEIRADQEAYVTKEKNRVLSQLEELEDKRRAAELEVKAARLEGWEKKVYAEVKFYEADQAYRALAETYDDLRRAELALWSKDSSTKIRALRAELKEKIREAQRLIDKLEDEASRWGEKLRSGSVATWEQRREAERLLDGLKEAIWAELEPWAKASPAAGRKVDWERVKRSMGQRKGWREIGKDKLERAFAWLERYAPGSIPESRLKIDITDTGRAKQGAGKLYLVDKNGVQTVLHEFGHWVEETYPAAQAMVEDFLFTRISVKNPRFWKRSANEWGFADKFIDKYVGRIYKWEWKPSYTAARGDRLYGTEIFSMGIQKMYQDPVAFLRKDPEHFKLTLRLLMGLF